MSKLLALDIALLPPPDVSDRAIALSASLPEEESQGLRLGPDRLPHITLTQEFVRADELDAVFERVDAVLRTEPALHLTVTGAGKGGAAVWMSIERTPALVALHERLMEATRGLDRPGATAAAFADEDARVADVLWVTGYRLQSSFGAFTPHITIGHAERPPVIEPFEFTATTVGACHLGRHCTCRPPMRTWTLKASASAGS